MRVKLALSTLCENPGRRTGLSTLFPEFVSHARRLFPEVSWLIFAGQNTPWPEIDDAVEICRDFPSNENPVGRMLADHYRVAPAARRRGAAALLTVGFMPLQSAHLPVAMHVFSVDGQGRGDWIRTAYRRWAIGRGLASASLVIANSEWTRAHLGPSRGLVMVSPEGVRHDIFKPEGERGALGFKSRYLLWVSNLYPYKRIGLALAAYAALPERIRAEFPLVVVGGGWALGRERAEATVEKLGIQENVHFLGWVADEVLPSLYRGATAHILSTSRETFGRSVLEAMACGCPNVIQDIPVLREVAGESAVYVDYADQGRATAALQRVCSEGGRNTASVAAGVARSLEFSFERLAGERVRAVLAAIGRGMP